MTSISSPAEIITLLKDIESRSQHGASELTQQHNSWAAVDFRIGQDHYLIPLNETREIFPIPEHVTLVPKSEPWVFGIANLRGELLPLFDLNYFLSGQATKINKRSRIIVINHDNLYSGLLLDEVFGLKHFHQEPEEGSQTNSAISPYLNGHISQQEHHWDVFSFNKLAADPRFLNAAA
ncbi:MAG: purine-binding chemotaxis protein CheW [Proteobacteria bacterium]|nr:purine-binding chemotaxis protein CheW [Pseudomonadota bacterium]